MSVQEIEKTVAELPEDDREQFAAWFAEFRRQEETDADAWDEQIARDAKAGRLDAVLARAKAQVAAGRFSEILSERNQVRIRGLESSAGS